MKIYADSYYIDFFKSDQFVQIRDFETIPDNVDIIGITRYTADLKEHQRIIDFLLPKTKKLYVTLIEAVNHDLVDFLLYNHDPRIEFFLDSDLNVPVPNVKTITSWFMCSTNLYITSPQAKSLLDQLIDSVDKPKYFDCLLGTKKRHRDQIQRFYNKSSHQDKFLFSYYKDNIHDGLWSQRLPEQFKYSADVITYQGFECSISTLIPVEIYNLTHYSIVAETTAHNTHNQYTEKLAKPILAGRLFVAFAGQHYLRNLKLKGFRTFDSIIDESYDSISDASLRFSQAWAQVEYLCEQDPAIIKERIRPIVEHNRAHFLSSNWHDSMVLTFSNLGSESMVLGQQPAIWS